MSSKEAVERHSNTLRNVRKDYHREGNMHCSSVGRRQDITASNHSKEGTLRPETVMCPDCG